jgi:SPP1 gp7 family putative phage head morphogenesis protein
MRQLMAVTRDTLRLAKQLRIMLDRRVDVVVRQLVEAWARGGEEIDGEWEAAIADLIANSSGGRWPNRLQIARASRAQQALSMTTEQVVGLAEFSGVTVSTGAREVSTEAAFWQARLIASQMPEQAGTAAELAARFDRVQAEAIGAIVERTTEQITALTRPLPAFATDAMKRALVRGVAIGENPRAAAKRMVDLAQSHFNGGLTRALVIARTEMLDAHRSASAAAQLANEDVLRGWVWHAQLDSRTCPSCWARHGTVHDLTEVGPNDHQQGRCSRTPVTKSWAELGFDDIIEPVSLLPDAGEVFAGLSRDEQLKVMGPVRLKALDAGVLSLADLAVRKDNPGWRPSWVPMSTKAVRRRMLRSA